MAGAVERSWLGSARIWPDGPANAGELGTWRIDYVVGLAGVDDGGRIRVCLRTSSDWAAPQFRDPTAADYVSVRATQPVKLALAFGREGVRPWAQTITVRVTEGALGHGDRVTLVLGDTIAGGPGMRAQTFAEERFRFRLQVDPFGTALYQDVALLELPVAAVGPAQLALLAPSDVVAGEPSWLHLRAVDRWGNVATSYRGEVAFGGDRPEGLPAVYRFTDADGGVRRFEGVRYARPGALAVTARDEALGMAAQSNPIRCHDRAPDYRLYWGDLHGQSGETVGTGSIEEYFAYARDVAAVDVTAHQGNDFQITAEVWERLERTVEHTHVLGRFVTFHGYEWSGITPAGGDHNVHYLHGGPLRRSSHTQIPDRSDADSDCYPVPALYAANAGRDDVLITPHVGGRRANLDYHDPHLERVIEIASQWGRFEWFAREALERGLRVGFVAGSDDHSGRPGWSAPTIGHHGVRGGLTAFLAPDLTREAIWEALRARRCYGTTGPRIILEVSVDGHPMGEEYIASTDPTIRVRVLGTAPIDTVEVRRGLATVATCSGLPEPAADEPWRVRLAWRGARNRDRSRALDWTGGLEVWGGRIARAENYAIDSPLDGIVHWDADRVAWHSHTCGDWDGVILDLEGDDATALSFTSPAMRFRCTLGELAGGPLRYDGPHLEQRVVVRRLPHAPGATELAFTWRDEASPPGANPYWIWVTQADGEMAWSSPVFATCLGPLGGQ